jgi:hypothetical protein
MGGSSNDAPSSLVNHFPVDRSLDAAGSDFDPDPGDRMAHSAAGLLKHFIKVRHFGSGALSVLGSLALIYMAVQQSSGYALRLQDLWVLGVLVAVTFEAIARFFRPTSDMSKVTIWSLTLMGCSCLAGGFAQRNGYILGLGGAMIVCSFIMAVIVPAGAIAGRLSTDRS